MLADQSNCSTFRADRSIHFLRLVLKKTEMSVGLLILLMIGIGCAGTKLQSTRSGHRISQWANLTSGISASHPLPTAGEDFAIIYDPIQHQIVLFGGKNDHNQNLNEVWAFAMSEKTWREIKIEGEAPPASEDHTLIYDPIGNRMILYGGEDGPTRNATWSFDSLNRRWRDLSKANAPQRSG